MKSQTKFLEKFIIKSLDSLNVKISKSMDNLVWVDGNNVPKFELVNNHKYFWVKKNFIDEVKLFFSCQDYNVMSVLKKILFERHGLRNCEFKISNSMADFPVMQLHFQNVLSISEINFHVKNFVESKNFETKKIVKPTDQKTNKKDKKNILSFLIRLNDKLFRKIL